MYAHSTPDFDIRCDAVASASLAVADLNRDGLAEIVVGSPLETASP
ncbi:hypothetical protein ACFXJM_37620 [Streptomyces massasporeus]